MSLVVLHPGISSRVVDQGRPGSRSLGVPVGGAADRRARALGNALLDNAPDAAALEICSQGPRLRAETDTACALFGAPFTIHADGMPIEAGHTFSLRPGAELRIGGTAAGMRAYLCVRGGFDVPLVLGSRDSLQPLQKGDVLPCEASNMHRRFCPLIQPSFPDEWTLRVLPGLQASLFDEAEWLQTYTAQVASDRMGTRLQGTPLAVPAGEMTSEPACPGTVQVTNDGQCIVLGVDAQTIGGYPKIAQVIRADLDALGQIRPEQRIRFVLVSMEDAIQADRAALHELRGWTNRLRLGVA
jgi:biotin-dependent carboxylase-like uncharacterized protein